MRRLAAAALLACACGGASPAAHVVELPATRSRGPTTAERRADVCARRDLAPGGETIAAAAESPAEHGVVRDVAVRDAAGRNVQVGADALAPIAIGKPYDEAAAQEVERRVWKTGRFSEIALETTPADGGVHLVVRVAPKRTIGRVFLQDDATADDLAALRVAAGAVYDPAALFAARGKLRNALFEKGLLDAEIALSSASGELDPSTVDVCVRIRRGPIVTVGSIEVHGSAFDAELRATLAREDTTNVAGAVPDYEVLDRDDLVLQAELWDRGLLSSKVVRKVDRTGDALAVSWTITDGPVFHYGKIDVRGALAAPKARYLALLAGLKRGAVFRRSDAAAAIQAIEGLHAGLGRSNLTVEPDTELDAAHGTVSLVFVIGDRRSP